MAVPQRKNMNKIQIQISCNHENALKLSLTSTQVQQWCAWWQIKWGTMMVASENQEVSTNWLPLSSTLTKTPIAKLLCLGPIIVSPITIIMLIIKGTVEFTLVKDGLFISLRKITKINIKRIFGEIIPNYSKVKIILSIAI